jgi:tetratricopeptide (TPR) repeat protein
MRNRFRLVAFIAAGLGCLDGGVASAQSPSFDCNKARFPDELAICRNPELAELDNVAAAAHAYLKSTRGRAFADEIGIPFWRLRQACQYDAACIRQRQIEALNSYQAAGAPIPMLRQSAPQQTFGWNAGAAAPSPDPSSELHECRNSKDAADRIAHCSNVIAVSRGVPALVTAHNTRGLALVEVGRFREAIDDFSFVIAREPNIAGFYDNRENAYRQSSMFNEALGDASKAILLAPTYSFPFRSRGNVYNDMGKYDLAVEDYSQAIRISPEDGGLFIDRGRILRSQSKFDDAISDFSARPRSGQKMDCCLPREGSNLQTVGED